jgi:hypothetical protein
MIRLTSLLLCSALVISSSLTPTTRASKSGSRRAAALQGQTPFLGTPFAVPGTIQSEDFDNGGEGVAFHDFDSNNWGGQYRATGVDIETCSEGGHHVCCAYGGEWLEYTVNVTAAGTYNIEARVASAGTGGLFHIEFNGLDKTGAMLVPNTGGWNSFQAVTKTGVSLSAGQQVMRISMDSDGPSGAVGNFHLVNITSAGGPPPPGPTQTPFLGTPFAVPGTIQSEDFDNGGEGVAYHDRDNSNWGGQYRSTGVDIETCNEGGYHICCAYGGEWLEYTVNVAAAGTYNIEARVASAGTGGLFHIEFNGQDKTGGIQVPNTGSWNTFQTVTKPGVTLNAGQQVMRIAMDSNGPSGAVANFHFIRITNGSPAEDPAVVGQWSAARSWPLVAIHTSLLPNGQVLVWSRDKDAQGNDVLGSTQAQLWNPATDTFTPVPNPTTNLFCSAHSLLPDGRLLVTGGHKLYDNFGERHTNIFDFTTNTWTRVADMNAGRWYPSNCTLPNGEVLVISGTEESGQFNRLPQVWQTGGGWRSLTNANRQLPLYPWMLVAPNGKAFYAGPERETLFLDTAGAGAWTAGPVSNWGYRDYGSAVMYEPGKILIVGGGNPTNTAEVINLNNANPSWRYVGPMTHARRQLNATILADGKVLITGGSSGAGHNNSAGAVLAAEMWDPATEQWSLMASMQVRRLYHSTAVLLPDGRVLSAGGGLPWAAGETENHLDAEIYSPPYLFKGPRPVIVTAPLTVSYNRKISVVTPDVASITGVLLVKLSSVTHAFNENQRMTRLSFTRGTTSLSVTTPPNRNVCPPGHYMLFIINGVGVPSVAKIIRVG